MEYPQIQRRASRPVQVGSVVIGGGAPVSIQSMTTTATADVSATLGQVRALASAGCDIVRVAVPTRADTAALREIVAGSPVPIVADVHFHFRRALEAVEAGVAKIRLNPGTLADRGQVREVIAACRAAGVPIRVGVNEGSVHRSEAGRRRDGGPAAGIMAEALEAYLEPFHEEGFEDLVLSAKSRDAVTCVAVNRILAGRFDYPLHLGLTHSGTARTGLVRSMVAVGALLAEGIGDTVRISLAGDPMAEVTAAKELLWSLRLRQREGVEVIACPTCGRTRADVNALAEAVGAELADVREHLTVAVMGCVVNGPGEAEGVDAAACCGKSRATIYRRGRRVRTVPLAQIVPALVEEARRLLAEG